MTLGGAGRLRGGATCAIFGDYGHMSDDLNYTLLENALAIGGVVRRSVDLDTGEIISPENCYSDHEQKIGFEKKHFSKEKDSQKLARSGRLLAGSARVSAVAPLSKSHIRPEGRFEAGKQEGKPFVPKYRIDDHSGLVKVGKEPSVSWREGASYLKTSQGSNGEQVGGGKRKVITGFSANSRRRLMYTIASIRRDASLPCFVTLTYPKIFPDPKSSKRHLKIFCQRLQRAFPLASAIWKLEPQDRGAPHYHLLVWGADEIELKKFVPYAWHEIAGDGDNYHLLFHLGVLDKSQPCVSLVRSFRGVWSYASKYLGKSFSVAGWEDKHTGKFWGYVNHSQIPFGMLCELEVTSSRAFHVMRYQRRFSKRRVSNKGFTLFCDASQWVKNIFSEVSQ